MTYKPKIWCLLFLTFWGGIQPFILTPSSLSHAALHQRIRVEKTSTFFNKLQLKSSTSELDWPVQIVENSAIVRRALALPLGFASAGNWLASCIYVASKLRIPDALARGPKTVAELATDLQVDADALGRLMRSLAGQGPIPGIFIELFDSPLGLPSLPLPSWMRSSPKSELARRYALTPMGALLRDGSVGSMRPWAIFCGEELGRAWSAGLLTAVRTGAPAFGAAQAGAAGADPDLAAEDFWGYMSRNPAARETFDASMQALSAYSASPGEAADLYDWTLGGRARWIVDVGGGTGLLLASILAKHPVGVPARARARAHACRAQGLRGSRAASAVRGSGIQSPVSCVWGKHTSANSPAAHRPSSPGAARRSPPRCAVITVNGRERT